ncbi:MAG: hypothetical protein AAF702_48540 [Chloroflexota bacterium]
MNIFRSRDILFFALILLLPGCSSAETVNPLLEGVDSPPNSARLSIYQDQTIQLVVPFSPGGGTDTWARTIAPALQKHLGHNVRVQVINKSGNSGVAGTNDFFENHTSQTLLVSSGSIFFPYLLGDSTVAYEFNELVPILGSPVGGIVFVSSATNITSVPELCQNERKLRYAGISASGLDIVLLVTFELFGMDVDAEFGHDGKGASRVAFEQGEADIEYQTTPGYLANEARLVGANDAVPLFTFGILSSKGEIVRDPAFPNLPTVEEAYTTCWGEEPSGVAWDIYKALIAAGVTIQKVMWVHGNTSEEAINELRRAAAAAVTDPGFSESAQNLLGDYDFFVGHEAQVTFAAASNLSAESITWLKSLLAEKYGDTTQ